MNWRREALCALLPVDAAERMFFGNNTVGLAEGRALCRRCPVSGECLADADRNEGGVSGDRAHAAGIWGGLGVSERIARRKTAV